MPKENWKYTCILYDHRNFASTNAMWRFVYSTDKLPKIIAVKLFILVLLLIMLRLLRVSYEYRCKQKRQTIWNSVYKMSNIYAPDLKI